MHQAGTKVELVLSEAKKAGGAARTRHVLITTLSDEVPARYREWVERNRAWVHAARQWRDTPASCARRRTLSGGCARCAGRGAA